MILEYDTAKLPISETLEYHMELILIVRPSVSTATIERVVTAILTEVKSVANVHWERRSTSGYYIDAPEATPQAAFTTCQEVEPICSAILLVDGKPLKRVHHKPCGSIYPPPRDEIASSPSTLPLEDFGCIG